MRFDQTALSEIELTRELRLCSNIIQIERVYYEAIEVEGDGAIDLTFYIVMQFAKYGTLFSYLLKQERLSEEHIRRVI